MPSPGGLKRFSLHHGKWENGLGGINTALRLSASKAHSPLMQRSGERQGGHEIRLSFSSIGLLCDQPRLELTNRI